MKKTISRTFGNIKIAYKMFGLNVRIQHEHGNIMNSYLYVFSDDNWTKIYFDSISELRSGLKLLELSRYRVNSIIDDVIEQLSEYNLSFYRLDTL